jgi:DNA invertase Pin-like site-specific DNA recombinase
MQVRPNALFHQIGFMRSEDRCHTRQRGKRLQLMAEWELYCDTPTAVLVRQVLGAIAQFEKASLVAKLKAARDRKRAAAGKCEGRKSWAEINPELVREAMHGSGFEIMHEARNALVWWRRLARHASSRKASMSTKRSPRPPGS